MDKKITGKITDKLGKNDILHPNPDPVIPKEKLIGEQVIKTQNERVVEEAKSKADQIKFEKGQKKRPHGDIQRPRGEGVISFDNKEEGGEDKIIGQPILRPKTQREE
mgnify:CR=1 FL=1